MSDAFSHPQFVALTGSVEAWTGVEQEAAGTLALSEGGAKGRRELLSGLRHVRGLALAADGSALAMFIDEDGDERGHVVTWTRGAQGVDWRAMRADGAALAVQELAISSGGTRLALLVETPQGFEILVSTRASEPQLSAVLLHAGPLRGLALSGDGRYLVVAHKEAREDAAWTLRFLALERGDAPVAVEAADDLFPCAVLSGPDPVVLVSTSSGTGAGAALWRPGHGLVRLALGDEPGATLDVCDVATDGRVLGIRWKAGEAALVTCAAETAQASVAPVEGALAGARWTTNGGVTCLWSDARTPLTLASFDPSTGRRLATLAAHAGPAKIPSIRAESLTLVAADGLAFQCWCFSAPGTRAPRGLVLDIHGGPDDLVTNQFVPERQAWLEAGFVVMSPNYRGSAGFGRSFARANFGDPGRVELLDIQATLAAGRERFGDLPVVLSGWSYGAFLALQQAIAQPASADAVLAHLPVLDWTVQHESAPPQLARLQEELFGAELQDEARRELYRQRSPLTHAGSLSVPTLVVFAEGDVRCPASAVRALRAVAIAAGLPVSFHEIEGGHSSAELDSAARRRIFGLGLDFVEEIMGR